MPMFGSSAPASAAMQALPYDPSQLSTGDKWAMFSAMLKDAGAALRNDDQGGGNVNATRNLLMQRQLLGAQQQFLRGMIGGSAPQAQQAQYDPSQDPTASAATTNPDGSPQFNLTPDAAAQARGQALQAAQAQMPMVAQRTGGITPSDPRYPALIAYGHMLGVDTDGINKAFELQKPYYEGGVRIANPYGPGPDYIPKQVDGQRPIYDPRGRFQGVDIIPGAPQSTQAMAAAQAYGAGQGAAPWATAQIPTSGGAQVSVPGDLAQAYLRRQFLSQYGDPTAPPASASGAPAGPQSRASGYAVQGGGPSEVGDLGRTPTDAEKALSTGRAAKQVELEALQPKELSTLNSLDQTSQLTSQVLHQALGDVLDPKTGRWIVGAAKPQANWTTTGTVGAALRHLPGSPAYDLDQQMEHVRAMTSLDELQKLRDNSPTGAGLGRVTQSEIDLLAAMRGSLDQGQGTPQFTQNLRRQLQQLDATVGNRHQLYQSQYGDWRKMPLDGVSSVAPLTQAQGARAPVTRTPSAPTSGAARGYQIVGVRRAGQ